MLLFVALFKSLGSKHSLNHPFCFSTITREFTQSVGSWMGCIIPISVVFSNSFFNFGFMPNGMFLGDVLLVLHPDLLLYDV